MNEKRIGRRTIALAHPPSVLSFSNIGGKFEKQGPLSNYFDETSEDSFFGEKTWEKAESAMQKTALCRALEKGGMTAEDMDYVLAGDLLNQCIGTSFGLRDFGIPFFGLYGACSTMAESLIMAAIAVNGGYADHAVAMTSSHFASSERQFRFPLGYGGQRTPTAQWTVTGAGAALVSANGYGPRISACTIGTVTDLGITDSGNMGAAMAPAALDTITAHFEDFHCAPQDYDLIVTGDLGQIGKELLLELARKKGLSLGGKLTDCGTLIFDDIAQDTHAGGSGCGCSAVALCGYFLEKLNSNKLNRILFCGTGALLSPTSTQQGLPIPGICHAVSIEKRG